MICAADVQCFCKRCAPKRHADYTDRTVPVRYRVTDFGVKLPLIDLKTIAKRK